MSEKGQGIMMRKIYDRKGSLSGHLPAFSESGDSGLAFFLAF
jgi:hypothetical protein